MDCFSAFAKRLLLSSSQIYTLGAIYFAVSLFVISINSLVIISLIKTGELKTSFNKIIFVLSVSDLCWGLLAVPLSGMIFTAYPSISVCTLEVVSTFIMSVNGYFSGSLFVWIALDRYVSINSDLSNNWIQKWMRSRHGLVVIILLSLILATVFGVLGITRKTVAMYTWRIMYVCIYVACILLYICLYYKIRGFRKKYADTLKEKRGKGKVHYINHVTKTVLVLIGVTSACYLPWIITKIISFSSSLDGKEKHAKTLWFISYIFMTLMFLSAGFNSVIILHRNKRLKNYVLKLLRNKNTQNGQSGKT